MKKFFFCLLALFAAFQQATTVYADVSVEAGKYAGRVTVDLANGLQSFEGPELVSGLTVIYDNIASPSAVNAAGSIADLGAIWGDRVTTIDTGYLDSISLSIFNSTTGNTNPILTTDLNIRIYDAVTFNPADALANTPLVSFTGGVNFGTGLNPGSYSIVTFTNLRAFLNAGSPDLSTTNLMVTQQLANVTGGSTRAGIVTFTNDNIGTQYINNNNWFRQPTGGAGGYFAFGAPASNRIAMSLSAVPEPGTAGFLVSMASLAIAFSRRRKA
jgi:hypothetical protein